MFVNSLKKCNLPQLSYGIFSIAVGLKKRPGPAVRIPASPELEPTLEAAYLSLIQFSDCGG
jgi:hypothetical protein